MAFDSPPLLMQAVAGDPALSYTAQTFRGAFDALVPAAGVTFKNDLLVAQRAAGTNMSVDVAAGQCAFRGNVIAYQGTYLLRNTAVINVQIATADPTNPRIDLIVVQVLDKQADSGTQYAANAIVVQGTAASPPTVPPTPADSYALAQVAVAAGATSISNANITDVRTLNTLGDVPLWELRGGNGQAVPNGLDIVYTGWTFSDLTGVGTNANPGEIVIRTPGRYVVSYTARISQGGTATAERSCYIAQVRGGSVARRIGAQGQNPSGIPTIGLVQTATGTARCNAGDILRAVSTQAAGVTLNLSDQFSELGFTGARVGP